MKRDSRPPLRLGRRAAFAGASILLASTAIVRAQGKASGYALVIGNSKYQWEASLPNVKRDAPDMARCFESLGLKTELVQDVGRDAINQALDRFKTGISRGANLAAFYFAGHGAAWAKDTYLVPIDADLQNDPADIPRLLEKLDEGYDVVFGIPKKMSQNWWRNLTSVVAKKVIGLVMGVVSIGIASSKADDGSTVGASGDAAAASAASAADHRPADRAQEDRDSRADCTHGVAD